MLDQNNTGSNITMKLCFNFLTFFFLYMAFITASFSQSFEQNANGSFLRWKIESNKSQLKVMKKQNKVILQSLDPDFFENFSEEISKTERVAKYHKNFAFSKPSVPGAPYKLEITLNNSSIELFSFYKADENSYMLDFWINQDSIATKNAARGIVPKLAKLEVAKKQIKKTKKTKSAQISKAFAPENNKINYISTVVFS